MVQTQKPYDAFTPSGQATKKLPSVSEDTERKTDDESEEEEEEMRFTTNSKGRLKVGKPIYQALVKKMLSLHIAHMERKIRACQRCPLRCPGGSLPKEKHPYSKPGEDGEPISKDKLPTWLKSYIDKTKPDKTKEKAIRKDAEALEDELERNGGNVDVTDQSRNVRQSQYNDRVLNENKTNPYYVQK